MDFDSASKTIASGVITQDASAIWNIVDTEGAAASDDLATVTRTSKGPNAILISPASGARTVVIKHGTGNILCAGNADVTLDDVHDWVWLLYDGSANWYAQSIGGGSAPGGAVYQHRWTANGPYRTDTSVDGGFISDSAFTITGVWIHRTTAGSSSSTILDLNLNGTTMYTTQANRPTIAFNDGDLKVDCTLPDVVSVSAGNILTIDIDQVEAGSPANISLIIEGG